MRLSENWDADTPSDTSCENEIIDEICRMPWSELHENGIIRVAQAYYFFSVQFRENLEIARSLWPEDQGLARLHAEECDTDNLSPWPGVAALRERLNHDEFIRRLLALEPLPEADADALRQAGAAYLSDARASDELTRAQSIISYENGGLSAVFRAILSAPSWEGVGARAFKFFLESHIRFDESEQAGHGSMVRHLGRVHDTSPLWRAFRDLLAGSIRALPDGGEMTRPQHCPVEPAAAVPASVAPTQPPAGAAL